MTIGERKKEKTYSYRQKIKLQWTLGEKQNTSRLSISYIIKHINIYHVDKLQSVIDQNKTLSWRIEKNKRSD